MQTARTAQIPQTPQSAAQHVRCLRAGCFETRAPPVCVEHADFREKLARFGALEARCGDAADSGAGDSAVASLSRQAERLCELQLVRANDYLVDSMAPALAADKKAVAEWSARMDAVREARGQTTAYIKAHEYSDLDRNTINGLVDVRAHYNVLDAADLALTMLVAQALGVRHGFDANDVLYAPYQLRKMETNNQWNNVYLSADVYEHAAANMAKMVAIGAALAPGAPGAPDASDALGPLRWHSAHDALHVRIVSQGLVVSDGFPPHPEWVAPYDTHVASFLEIPDARVARDTRLLLRILRGDRSQRLISRRLLDRCTAAIHGDGECNSHDRADRARECFFLQSFMEPAKHALVRSVMLDVPEAGRYDFMQDAEVRTGYLASEKAAVEAALLLAAPGATPGDTPAPPGPPGPPPQRFFSRARWGRRRKPGRQSVPTGLRRQR
jgi:hypothetical protein